MDFGGHLLIGFPRLFSLLHRLFFLYFLVSRILIRFMFLNIQSLDFNIQLFSILIIAIQLSTLIILWISIFIVIICTFDIQYRYQRCLFIFIIILFLIQICCFTAQALITLHCLFNLKFVSSFLDYGK